jgi:hypothetical protein
MFALAETAAIFVAILAGFYTTKLITIASDKKRLLIRIGEVNNEIEWRKRKAEDLWSKIDKMEKDTDDSRLRSLKVDSKSFSTLFELKTFEDLKKMYESHYGKISDYALPKLKEMSESLLKEIDNRRKEWTESIKHGKVPKSNLDELVALLPSSLDEIKACVIFEREEKVYDF